jgi:hypothetical protein
MGRKGKEYKKNELFDPDDIWIGRYQLPVGSAGLAKRDFDREHRIHKESKTLRQLIQEGKSNSVS